MGKRAFDLVMTSLGLLVLALPMLLVALAIRLDSPGPVLFRQTRVGKGGVPFSILKFRTMRHALAEPAQPAPATAPPTSLLTLQHDARITRMGRLLRNRRIDEWPQLINVLRGDMSLVGPRPEVPRYVALYPEAVRLQVLSVRPGVTDPAALKFRNEAEALAQAPDAERHYVEVILPAKLALQAEYVRRASVRRDIRLVWETVRLVMWTSDKRTTEDKAA